MRAGLLSILRGVRTSVPTRSLCVMRLESRIRALSARRVCWPTPHVTCGMAGAPPTAGHCHRLSPLIRDQLNGSFRDGPWTTRSVVEVAGMLGFRRIPSTSVLSRRDSSEKLRPLPSTSVPLRPGSFNAEVSRMLRGFGWLGLLGGPPVGSQFYRDR